ncbi:pyrimidine 5'-nucleotidase [Massilia sp. W12]|uniref:pyrimidine 5'-nucleotidase n=1 Tax=Massilia sp. W12 TaxID=3126507 RepID=UPI0030CF06EA
MRSAFRHPHTPQRRKTARRQLWLFDLDNTLHDAGWRIFDAIEQNMNHFIAARLGQNLEQVSALRANYWRRYGATVLGLIRHHNISAEEFLHPVHALPDLRQMMRYEAGLARLLRRLPGRKVLLTNAPAGYAKRVLHQLALTRSFARHVPIEAMRVNRRLRPKPDKQMLRHLLRQEGFRARDCILVEDSAKNLQSAKALGMRTVWITGYLTQHSRTPHWVDVKLPSVHALLRQHGSVRSR